MSSECFSSFSGSGSTLTKSELDRIKQLAGAGHKPLNIHEKLMVARERRGLDMTNITNIRKAVKGKTSLYIVFRIGQHQSLCHGNERNTQGGEADPTGRPGARRDHDNTRRGPAGRWGGD